MRPFHPRTGETVVTPKPVAPRRLGIRQPGRRTPAPSLKGDESHAPFFLSLLAPLTLAVGVAPAPAESAPRPCDKRERVLDLLAERYQEAPVAVGVTTGGGLVEVLTEPDGQTWTIIVTSPQGVSCLVLSGEGWRPLQQVAQDPEA